MFGILKPRMIESLLGSDALFGVGQEFEDEVFGFLGDVGPVVVAKSNIADYGHFLDLLEIIGLKGQVPIQHKIKNDSKTKSINFFIVVFHLIHLRRNKSRSSCIFFTISQIL